MAADLIALDIKHLQEHLSAMLRHIHRHADDLTPLQVKWMSRFVDAASEFSDSIADLTCTDCSELAVWQHPAAPQRYCATHREQFTECSLCGKTMRVADVQIEGPNSGHVACLADYAGARD